MKKTSNLEYRLNIISCILLLPGFTFLAFYILKVLGMYLKFVKSPPCPKYTPLLNWGYYQIMSGGIVNLVGQYLIYKERFYFNKQRKEIVT